MFRIGQKVRHRASGEPGIIVAIEGTRPNGRTFNPRSQYALDHFGLEPTGYVTLSLGFGDDNEIKVSDILLESF